MGRLLPKVRVCLVLLILCLGSLLGCQLIFGDVEIADAPAGPAECKPGDYRCSQENLLTCGGDRAGWVVANSCVTSAFCDDKKQRCRTCREGDRRCDGAVREACNLDGTDWETLEECESADTCSPGACGPCTPGDYSCGGADQRVLRQCTPAQTWEEIQICDSPVLCRDTIQVLASDPEAPKRCLESCDTATPFSCDGLRLLRCGADLQRSEVDKCANPQLCERSAEEANAQVSKGMPVFEKCLPGCQSPGAYFCNGMTLQQCRPDLTDWDILEVCEPSTECNPVVGKCTDKCMPGEYQCNGAELRRCRPNRTWETVQMCATAALCTPEANGCRSGACPVAGAYQCRGAVLERCSDDLTAWIPQNTCESDALCNAASKRCDAPVCPVAGELRCFGKELRQCNDTLTEWVYPNGRTDPLICGADEFCDPSPTDPGCKTECATTTGCNGAEHQTCSPAGWKTDATCKTPALCQCTLDPDGDGPLTNTCAGGLDADGKCGKEVCRVSGDYREYRCQGAKLQRCQASQNGWEDVATCESADLCYAGDFTQKIAGYCAVCTKPYEIQCNGNAPGSTLLQCTGDRTRWMTIQTCTNYPCVEDQYADYCATCNPGDAMCSGRNLLRCASDRRNWTTEQCESAALCDQQNKQCDKCVAGSVTCVGKELRKCSADGQTLTTRTCANICNAVTGQCDACAAGTAWCEGAVLYECSADGQMQSAGTTCATPALCDAANRRCNPPVCAVGQRRCTAAGQPQVCKTDRTGYQNDGMLCVTPELCTAGMCSPPACMPAEKQCDKAQPQVCNSGQTGFEDTGMPCATAQLCMNGSCMAPVCAVGERRCNMMQPQVCNPGRTGFINDGAACTTGQICQSGACVDIICDAGAKRCNMTQPQVCNPSGTAWTNSGAACASPQVCMAGACVTPMVCSAGDVRCAADNVLQRCATDGSAWTSTPCTGTTPVCNAMAGRCDECVVGSPATCAPGATAAVRTCSAAGKIVDMPCAATQTCMAGMCVSNGGSGGAGGAPNGGTGNAAGAAGAPAGAGGASGGS